MIPFWKYVVDHACAYFFLIKHQKKIIISHIQSRSTWETHIKKIKTNENKSAHHKWKEMHFDNTSEDEIMYSQSSLDIYV